MFTLALNTIRELMRNRFFSVILLLGGVFIMMSFILETLALGELRRVLYDFGLSFIELTGIAIILFLGGGMIAREIEGRTIFLMLSKPIPRSSIFLGKFLWFAFVIFLMLIIESILFLGLLHFHDIVIDPLVFHALLGIFLKLLSLLVVILFFSVFTSPMIALFLTLASYIIGHGGYAMLDHAAREGSSFIEYVGKGVLIFFPNLEALNLKNYVATSAVINLEAWYTAYAVAGVYIFLLLFVWSSLFSRRSFDNA